MNPLFEANRKHTDLQHALNRVRFRIRVEGVYLKKEPPPEVQSVCMELGVDYEPRSFNTALYEDREYIVKVPAFHIFYEDEWEETVYTADDVRKSIGQIAVKYTKKPRRWFWW
jgi:hypothetical protein